MLVADRPGDDAGMEGATPREVVSAEYMPAGGGGVGGGSGAKPDYSALTPLLRRPFVVGQAVAVVVAPLALCTADVSSVDTT